MRFVKYWFFLFLFFLCFLSLRALFRVSNFIDLASLEPTSLPLVKKQLPDSRILAVSGVIMDVKSGTVLFSKRPNLRRNPASITKIASSIMALETYPLEEVITVKKEYPVGKTMDLVFGERIKVRDLILGMLVHSANDAAFVLAGQSDSGIKKFVQDMNNFIEHLGLKNTHFVNFDGEDDRGHYSTSLDLAHLARKVIRNKTFEQVIQKKELIVSDVNNEIIHDLKSTNELLGWNGVKGIKTGWTPQAGGCFLGWVDLGGGHEIITVILGADDRFGETKKLISWAEDNIIWK